MGYILLWLLAVCLLIAGVVRAVRGDWLWAVILFILAVLVGPGGLFIGDFL